MGLQFNPETTFFKQHAVLLWLCILVVVVAVSSLIIWCDARPLGYAWSAAGFAYFVGLYSFPLHTLGYAGVPLFALLTYNHRSAQTAYQIEVANKQYDESVSQNQLANHLTHMNEFEGSIARDSYIQVRDARNLYKRLFPKSAMGDYSLEIAEMGYFTEALGNALQNIRAALMSGKTTKEVMSAGCEALMRDMHYRYGVALKVRPEGMFEQNIAAYDVSQAIVDCLFLYHGSEGLGPPTADGALMVKVQWMDAQEYIRHGTYLSEDEEIRSWWYEVQQVLKEMYSWRI